MDDDKAKPKRRYQYSSKQKANIQLRKKISKRKKEIKSLELRTTIVRRSLKELLRKR